MTSPAFTFPDVELVSRGHLGCQGCGASLAMRHVLKALGPKTIVVMPACCWSVIAGAFPHSALKVPLIHTAFETGAATASGVRAGLDIRGESDTTVMAWVGDGGTFDIGIQALSGAAERNENILYVCYDNEAYMNTGNQRSSATPWGALTTTTPGSKRHDKKDIMQIMAAHRIPYAATASVSDPEDVIRKFQKAQRIQGTRFIHLLTPCPPGWKISSELAVKLGRMAVRSRAFPIFEVEDGIRYSIREIPDPLPVQDYLRIQGRFRHLSDSDYETFQGLVDERWERLQQLAHIGEDSRAHP